MRIVCKRDCGYYASGIFFLLGLSMNAQAGAAGVVPISGCGVTLSAPGAYQVTADLTAVISAPCISITVSHVSLYLNGHTLTGIGPGSNNDLILADADPTGTSLTGIEIFGPGTLTNGNAGLALQNVDSSFVLDVTSTGNVFGFSVTSGPCNEYCVSVGIILARNVATANSQHGFFFNDVGGSVLEFNTASSNGADGFYLDGLYDSSLVYNNALTNGHDGIEVGFQDGYRSIANVLDRNNASGNSVFDAADDALNCENGDYYAYNYFAKTNQSCVQ